MKRCAVAVLLLLVAGCHGASTPGPATPMPPPLSVTVTVDSASDRHAISPYIYGANQYGANQLDGAGRVRSVRLGRLGGNRWTAYNWETNASNAGADFRHQNDDFLGGGDVAGEAVRVPVARAHALGMSMIVTVPMAGYVAADKAPPGDVALTPDFLNTRFLESRAAKRRGFSYPPDTSDRVVYQDEFVAWLESTFPYARGDGARTLFYDLDNEPDLWASTHPRIRPQGPITNEELVDRTKQLAGAIKAVAPDALVFGPATGVFGVAAAPDANGRDSFDFYLDSLQQAEAQSGRRVLDVLDIHWYPEAKGGGQRVTESGTGAALVAARLQAPRSLWDPTYVETSWVAQDIGLGAIRLLPRLREKVAAHYPGTRLAISEYNYGAGDHISGGIAQCDVLGIFGREGLFAAAMWELQSPSRYIDAAFDVFNDYDGTGARFGNTSIAASTSDVVDTSVYASVDDGREDRMVIVMLNKAARPARITASVNHTTRLRTARGFQLTADSPSLVPTAVSAGNALEVELPPLSVLVVELTP